MTEFIHFDVDEFDDLQCPVCGYVPIEVDDKATNPPRPQCYCPRCSHEDDMSAFTLDGHA